MNGKLSTIMALLLWSNWLGELRGGCMENRMGPFLYNCVTFIHGHGAVFFEHAKSALFFTPHQKLQKMLFA